MRTVSVKLMADASQFSRALRGGASDVRTLAGELDKANKAGRLDGVTHQAAGLGLGLLGVAGAAVKMAADFDKQMSSVKAATRAGAEDIGRLRQAALDAGADTKFSATEAAKGIEELSKAGVSTSAILGGGLKGALDLAAAGQLDVGEAAETAASAMTQFKLKGGQVPHVADLLAAAAGKAQGSVHDMSAALNQSGLIAAQTGLTIEDTTGTLAAFASAGLTGSDAGTSFKTMLQALQAPSGKTKELMDKLGISAYDAQGNFIGITALAGQLKAQLGTLTPALRANAMAQIFGSDATRAASILYEQGQDGIKGWIDKTNDAGYAAETARIMTDNLAGDIERLTGSLQTLAIESGSGANSGLRALTKTAGALVDSFGQLPPAVGSTVTVLAGAAGAATLLGAGWLKVRRSTAEMLTELREVGPVGARAATGLQTASKWAGRATVAFIGLQAAGAVVNAFMGDLNPQVEAATGGLEEWLRTCLLSGEAARLFGADGKDLSRSLSALANGGLSHASDAVTDFILGIGGVASPLDDAKEKTAAFDQALAAMVGKGNAKQAGELVARMAERSGVSVKKLTELLPTYAGAVENAGRATKDLAGGQKAIPDAAKAAERALRGERDALADLATEMHKQVDPVFALIQAQRDLKTAQNDAAAAIKKHGRNSEEAREATRKLALAAIDLEGKTGALGASFDGKLTPSMRATLTAAGLTKTQIKEVERQFVTAKTAADKFDGAYAAAASAPGAKAAKADLDKAHTAAARFAGPWVARLSVDGKTEVNKTLADLLIKQRALATGLSYGSAQAAIQKDLDRSRQRAYAAGGPVDGPGTKTSDSVVARLSVGEHVWTADEVDAVGGQGEMLRLRRAVQSGKRVEVGDDTPGFAGGGAVLRFPTNVRKTKIPKLSPPVPAGATGPWMERMIEARFPGLEMISGYRPGAHTLSGSLSYHALNRAVDFPPSRELARFMYQNYKARLKEAITPYQEYNVHNGRDHRYTGAVWRQHNFAGGNAHDHFAMANGGVIKEPVFGYGASGRSYSFAERGPETVIPGTAHPSPTVVVRGGGGQDLSEMTRLLADILTAAQHVGPDVAGALAGAKARAIQVSRAYGRAPVR